jgi:hypothetical protein
MIKKVRYEPLVYKTLYNTLIGGCVNQCQDLNFDV